MSGGLDSTTLAYRLAAEGHQLSLVSFDYGQRHVVELSYARRSARHLGAPHHVVDLTALGPMLSASALTGSQPVPDGHYAESSMKATVVPNRNMIFLAIAAGHAISIGADMLAVGVHAGDHFVYPDCRPPFIAAISDVLSLANEGFLPPSFHLHAPFLHLTKADIAAEAGRLGVPIEETWSCYKGGAVHCGRCGTCCERQEAFDLAGISDPTRYEDRIFWRSARDAHEGRRRACGGSGSPAPLSE